ncbi:MAG: gamma-glutamyl-gamma-aminobutyrate hydrolase family protein [Chlamydiota bacterium]
METICSISNESEIVSAPTEITQNEWDLFIDDNTIGFYKNLEDALLASGYLTTLRNIQILSLPQTMKKISNCTFIDCDLKDLSFAKYCLDDVVFSGCNLEDTSFFQSKGTVSCQNCYLIKSCWNGFKGKVEISGSDLSASTSTWPSNDLLEGATFLETQLDKESFIKNVSLTNAIFGSNEYAIFFDQDSVIPQTKPLIFIGTDVYQSGLFGMAPKRIMEQKNQVVIARYNHYPESIDLDILEKEIHESIDQYRVKKPCGISSAEWILENRKEHGEIQKVARIAKNYFSKLDGLMLPGGSDIPEVFYTLTPQTLDEDGKKELLRSVMEFALLKLSLEADKPILATCRGAQIANIFLGGSLKTLDDYQEGMNQPLIKSPLKDKELTLWNDLTPEAKKLFQTFQNEKNLLLYSSHHQALNPLGKGVLPILVDEQETPKFSFAQRGRWVLTQIHPEYAESPENDLELIDQYPDFLEKRTEIQHCLDLIRDRNRLQNASEEEQAFIRNMVTICENTYGDKNSLFFLNNIGAKPFNEFCEYLDFFGSVIVVIYEDLITSYPNGVEDVLAVSRCSNYIFSFFANQVQREYESKTKSEENFLA